MRVVIRRRTPNREAKSIKNATGLRMAGAGLMLQSLALGCLVVCVWRWSFDLGLAQTFPAKEGFFARWQIWFAAGATFQLLASLLARYARSLRHSEAGIQARLRSLSRRAA